MLWDIFHFGVLSCTENSTKSANQPNLAVLGLSSALRMQLCSLSVADVIAVDYSGNILSRDVTGQYDMTRSV